MGGPPLALPAAFNMETSADLIAVLGSTEMWAGEVGTGRSMMEQWCGNNCSCRGGYRMPAKDNPLIFVYHTFICTHLYIQIGIYICVYILYMYIDNIY